MDDNSKDFITVSHGGETDEERSLQEDSPEAVTGEAEENTENPLEAINDIFSGELEAADGNGSEAQEGGSPVYDDFMYQPIGFEELDREQYAAALRAAEKKSKRRYTRNERLIVLLFILIFLISAAAAVTAVVIDIVRGGSADFGQADIRNVVITQNSKPKGADDAENYKDKNGKYTTEGIAVAVRPSIVEIYTYSDSTHQELLGTGSGVIISDDGYIITNAHVLKSDCFHVVVTSDDKKYDATIIGRDSKTDLAVVKIDAHSLSAATLGDSDEVMVGEQVMAIGNPAGLSGSVTDGIVSAVNRKIRSDNTGFEMDCIQTNADISPGNSGGALVNMYGQVIGITSSKYISSSYEGLGFAITINEALPIIKELISTGFISGRFRIGITVVDMSSDVNVQAIEEALGFEIPDDFRGIYIESISDDSDIKNTKLVKGDFITAINGKTVSEYDEFYETISSLYHAGDYVPATCAHLDKDGTISCYDIKFRLIEDKSGDY